MEIKNNNRVFYLDFLRVIATYGVIVLHTAASNWYSVDVSSFEWNIFNIWDSSVRWTVPVFVMISGVLFLNPQKNVDIKSIYTKNILRMLTSFLFWSVMYAIFRIYFLKIVDKSFISCIFSGYYHMWFLVMIAGIYVLIPILRKIIESEWVMKYFLLLSVVFCFVANMICDTIIPLFPNLASKNSVRALISTYRNMNLHLVMGYTGYFIAGYYLNQKNFSKKEKKIVYFTAIVGLLVTIIISALVSQSKNEAYGGFYGNFTMNVMTTSIGVFVVGKSISDKLNYKIQSIFEMLSKYCFGIYLIHAMILEFLDYYLNLNTLSFNCLISVPCIALIVFILSFMISVILNHIPILKKYIV